MNRWALWIYRLFMIPPVVILLPLVALFQAKVREGLRLRRQSRAAAPPGLRPLWIHAASGEFEYAKAVIREAKQRWPERPVVVTYFSPTFAKAVASFAGVDLAMPLPLDLPGPCRSFLQHLRPQALLIARTDLWPEMLEQCRVAGVPVVLFSYTQKEFSSALKRHFTQLMLRAVPRIYCVTARDRDNLAKVQLATGTTLAVMGDTRYDQVAFRLGHGQVLPAALKPRAACLVAGSTWPEDEAVLLEALAPLCLAGEMQLMLVPHEPTAAHVATLETQVHAAGLRSALYSAGVAWPDAHVLIVDRVGVLAELYAWSSLAFVGGSFRKSVHSVMEALGAGCVTFVGPHHRNNREALDFAELGLVQVVHDADELREQVARALHEPGARGSQTQAEFQRRQGASTRLCDAIAELLI